MTLFIRLIIRPFQLLFLARTVFFSHNKSANSVFQPAYQHSRTGPILDMLAPLRTILLFFVFPFILEVRPSVCHTILNHIMTYPFTE
jgi:hypothetical protein